VTTFVDTSAFYAVLTNEDAANERAARWLDDASKRGDERLVTHSYVVVESIALIHRRLGNALVRTFIGDLLPVCEVRFVDETLHERAIVAYLAGLSRRSTFVDRVSFELMRSERIVRAFSFGGDFAREGFETVP
jgi:predicted nucleic acid-binding protein